MPWLLFREGDLPHAESSEDCTRILNPAGKRQQAACHRAAASRAHSIFPHRTSQSVAADLQKPRLLDGWRNKGVTPRGQGGFQLGRDPDEAGGAAAFPCCGGIPRL
jgi:hypothetical protein